MTDDTRPRDEEGAPAAGDFAPLPESADRAAPSSTAPHPQENELLDKFLAEYDEGIKAPPEQPQQAEQLSTIGEIDRLINEIHQPQQPAAGEIEAKARGLYEQERHKAELAQAFEGHVAGIQAKCPDHCPEGYARDALVAMAASDHRLEVAFRAAAAGVNRPQIMAELDRVNFALQHAARNPTADPNVIPALQQAAWQLSVAFHAGTILKQAEAEIVKRANSRAPIDREITNDVAAVVASLKSASQPFDAKEPAPNLGRMSDAQFRDYKSQFGF